MKTLAEPESHVSDAVSHSGTTQSVRDTQAAVIPHAAQPLNAVHSLQRGVGNRATRRILTSGVLQRKLTVGAPGDACEKEADEVAEKVLARTSTLANGAAGSDADDSDSHAGSRKASGAGRARSILLRVPIHTLQQSIGNRAVARLIREAYGNETPELRRKCACDKESGEECEECRAKKIGLQRVSSGDGAGLEAPPIVEEILATPGQPLADSARRTLEPAFGHDFSHVRVHDDSKAAESASAVNALAYTVGNQIVFGAGQYSPGTDDGNRLLAHELTHTLQNRDGAPRAGEKVREPEDSSEIEAEMVAEQVASFRGPPSVAREYNRDARGVAQMPGTDFQNGAPPLPKPGTPPVRDSLSALPTPAFPQTNGLAAQPTAPPLASMAPVTSDSQPPQTAETRGSEQAVPVPALSTTPAAAAPSSTGVARAETQGAGRGGGPDTSAAGPVSAVAPASANGKRSVSAGAAVGAPIPGAAAAAPAVHLDTGSCDAMLESLAYAPASSFPEALQSAKAASPALAARQELEVEKSYPEVERPTGMARGTGPGKAVPPPLGATAPAVAAPTGKGGGPPPPTKTEVATGPVPGANAPVSVSEPEAADEDGGSWWEWLTGRLQSLLSSLPTTDPGVSTSAGPRPETDLSGEANPAQNQAIANSGKEQVETQQARADAATTAKFGEDEIAPTVPGGKIRPRRSRGVALTGAHTGAKSSPGIPEDMRAQLDAAQAPAIKRELNQQLGRQRQQQAEFDKASEKAQEDGKHRLAAENERARQEQLGIKQQARADVNAEREHWRSENRKVLQNYSDGTQAKRAETEKQIDEKVKTTNKSVDDKLSDAETKADQERTKGEQQAAQKKAEVENKPHSFWDRVKGAVSSFFNEVKGAITHLFEEMRQAVKKIIDEAKTLVHEWIEAARQFVVGLIKTFGEFVKAAVSVALAAFPDLAKKACDWIDRRVNDAVNAVNRVANSLEKAIDSILDAVGAALDAALRAMQTAFLAILDGLETIANAVLAAMEWMAKLAELLRKFGAFLKGLGDLIATGAEKLLNEAKKTLQEYIDRIPGKVEAFVQEQAANLGKTAAKHIEGIWRHLKPALAYLKENWWTEVKQMVWNLVWPFNEKSPIWKDVPAMIKLPGKIIDSLMHDKISEAADEYLELWQKLNSVLGIFYGWFFIASVLVGAIIGSIVPGPGTVAGAIAGASVAGEVGEGLLIAMIATETAVIAKAAYDLAFGPGTKQVNESAYDRIANSGLTLGITDVMMVLGEIAADLAKAIIDGVKGLFKGEAPEVPKVEVPKEEPKPGEPAKSPAETDIAAKEPTADGHEIEVTKDGECLVCSTCEEIGAMYKQELEANPDLAKQLEEARAIGDPDAKAKAIADLEKKLEEVKAKQPKSPEMKVHAMADAATDAAGALRDLKEVKLRSDEVGELRTNPATKKELAKLEAEVDALERRRVELQEDADKAADAAKDPDLEELAAEDAEKIRQELEGLKSKADKINQEIDEKLQEQREAKAKEAARRLEAEQQADMAGKRANNICDETDGTARPEASIGDGSTEAVLQEEIRTGKPIKSPEGHWIKTKESIGGLERSIRELNEARPMIDDPAKLKAIDDTLIRANDRLAKLQAAWDDWAQRATTHPDVFNPDGSSKTTPGWP